MSSININRLTNCNVYDNGASLLGKVEEITLPAIKNNFVDHKALGMSFGMDLPGGFDKMSGKIKWNAVYPDLIKKFGSPFVARQIQVRGNLETYDSAGRLSELPLVAYLTIRFKDVLPPIGFKQNDNVEMESEYSCTQYKLEVDGAALIEVDTMANIYIVDGKDQLVNYRTNLGL